jgi:hypothetical protein
VVAVDAGRDAGVDVLADAAAVPDTAVPVVAPADAAQAPDVAIAANVARHGCSCELGHRGAEMPAGAALVVLVVALRRRRRR